jgi:hypothetical protein
MEPPDFEQIARESWQGNPTGFVQMGHHEGHKQDVIFVPSQESIAEKLREVWNARGAADLQAIEAALDFAGDAYADLHLQDQRRAIRKLDR